MFSPSTLDIPKSDVFQTRLETFVTTRAHRPGRQPGGSHWAPPCGWRVMDEVMSSGSADFEDFEDDDLWRAEEGIGEA